MGWTDLYLDMGGWRAVVDAAMNLWFPQNAGNFLTSKETLSYSRENSIPWS